MGKSEETRGRPKLPDKIRRDQVLRVRLSENEQLELENAAQGKLSTWAREILLAAARMEHKETSGG